MRISHRGLDREIESNVITCLMDMGRVGIAALSSGNDWEERPLLVKATELYCKWQFDYQGKGETYMKSYENLRDALSLCGDYNV